MQAVLIRWAVLATIAAACIGAAFVKGMEHQKEIDDVVFNKIRGEQDAQAIHAGQIAVDRANSISKTVDDYETELANLRRYYGNRLREQTSNRPTTAVPTDSLPKDTDWRSAYSGLTTAYGNLASQYEELEDQDLDIRARCAETTLMYLKLREAAKAVETIN